MSHTLHTRKAICFATLLSSLAASSIGLSQNLVTNGNFETGVFFFYNTPLSADGWSYSASGRSGSDNVNARNDLYEGYFGTGSFTNLQRSPDGGKFLTAQNFNFAESSSTATFEASQLITGLNVGEVYELTFYQTVVTSSASSFSANWEVSFGGDSFDSPAVSVAGTETAADWVQVKRQFTANAESQLLTFRSGDLGVLSQRLALDGVSIVAVPEPSAPVLLGIAGIAVAIRRRRR